MKKFVTKDTFRVIIFDLNGTITDRVSEHPSHIAYRNSYIEENLGEKLMVELPTSTTLALQVCGIDPLRYYIARNSQIDWNQFHAYNASVNSAVINLKKTGYKLVLYSDCLEEQIKRTLNLLKMENMFDMIISEEFNMKKPTPKAFKYIANSFDCSNSDLLMVGNDYYKDLLPLIMLGGNAIQLEGTHELTDLFKFISSVKEE